MKFLVLALCVCAASAASFGSAPFGAGGYKAYKGFQNTVAAPAVYAANVVATPAVVAAKTVESVAAPVVAAPVAAAGAATYQAGAATYQAGAAAYQGAKQVVNKAYGSNEGDAAILRSESEVGAEGYKYTYETANGISGEASGALKQVGDAAVVVSQGGYRYTAPDGTPVLVTYTADENGFHPQSDVLPVGPEIPEPIARSLAYIAAHAKDAVQNY